MSKRLLVEAAVVAAALALALAATRRGTPDAGVLRAVLAGVMFHIAFDLVTERHA